MNEPLERVVSSEGTHSPGATQFNLGRVMKATLVLVLIGGMAFAAVEMWNNQKATLAKVTGRVLWNGQPVTTGAVITEHTQDPLLTAIGALDSEGKFELSSNGEPGAALGTHKVVVAAYGFGVSPQPLVPQKYLKAKTTPLSIVVTKNPSKNHFELEVTGELPKSVPSGAPGNGPPGGGIGSTEGEVPRETGAAPNQPAQAPEPQ